MVIFLQRKFLCSLFILLVNFAAQAEISADSSKWNPKKDTIETRLQESFNTKIDSSNPVLVASESLDQLYDDGLIFHAIPNNDSILAIIGKASAVLAKIKKTQNFITNLNNTTGFELPVGISKTIGGLNYDIAIHAIRLKPTYAEIDVYMQFEIPQNGKKLTFMASGIKFSKAGGIIGDAKLALVGDYAINFNGDKSQLVLKGSVGGTGGTFVRMDCDGFREMGLDAEVRFSRDLLLPEDAAGVVRPTGNVIASFQSAISNWNDLLVQISLPNFQVANLTGFGFSIEDAVFDFSDTRNAPSVIFPKGYSVETDPSLVNLWRGVYVRKLSVRLPPHFKDKKSPSTSLTASDLLIDHQGVSGVFIGRNLIPLDNGDMSGWAFSLDSLGVELQANQLVQAGFNGGIVIPISGEQKSFDYKAIINNDANYIFNVTSKSDMSFPMFQAAKVDIYKGSSLEVRVQDGTFLPKANLHGRMNVKAKLSEGGQGLELADIRFENLQIQSVKPYIEVGTFSFGSEALQQKMAGFPISISEIGLRNITDKELGLDFRLKLNLVGESDGGFAADAGLTIVGNMGTETGSQRWQFKSIDVRDIAIDINGGAFKFKGRMVFYKNDKAYGDGFNGIIDAEFASMVKLTASAIFGNVNGMRYWYADAMASFKPGLPIFTGVAISGFGGGAYFKMKMDNAGGSELGRTASGIIYVPDEKSGLGLKATVAISSSPNDAAFNADVTFEISFFASGGVRYVAFMGNAFIATPQLDDVAGKIQASTGKMLNVMKKKGANAAGELMGSGQVDNSMVEEIQGPAGPSAGKKGAISARIFISYDFENSVLHANFNVGINVVDIITGGGEAVLHFAPHEWYVYVGTPDNRFNLSFGIGSLKVRSDTYLMVGTKILSSPPPPENVSRILGGRDFNYMKDLNEIGTGGGFAFGSSFGFDTGKLSFLVFYARFAAGAGFDIMLKNYGDVHCEGSNNRIGVNGWYANGQVYAYIEGAIGIHVDLFMVSGDFEILSVGAAAILQAQFPNPFWMQGTVGGRFSILGGVVSGNCSFQVTLGNKCKLVQEQQNVLSGIKVISQLTPAAGEKEVNVFNAPQAVFNMPVDKVFSLSDQNVGKTIQRSFRIKLEQFKFTSDGKEIAGTMQWNEAHDVVALNPLDVLPPKKEIKGVVEVSFEELKNGTWTPSLYQGKSVTEKLEGTFTTGEAPNYIPLTNVAYSYPVIGQLNYYKDETREGYIKLKQGQPYLFEPTAEWRQTGRFTSQANKKSEFDFTYSSGLVSFSTPSDLQTGQVYAFELLNVPKQVAGAVDRNVSEQKDKVTAGNESIDAEIKTKKAEGSLTQLEEKAIFSTNFRSSQYASLGEKMTNNSFSNGWTWFLLTGVKELGSNVEGEMFDKFEVVSSAYEKNSLIQFEADLSGNSWYENFVFPLVYEGYPINGDVKVVHRPESFLNVPPARAIYWRQTPSDIGLTPEMITTNSVVFPTSQAGLIYNLPIEMYRDYIDIATTCANLSLSQNSSRIDRFLTTPFPALRQGDYKIKVKYQLPGINKVTSEKLVTINYTLTFVR